MQKIPLTAIAWYDLVMPWMPGKKRVPDAAFAQPVPLNIVREHWLKAMDESRLSQRFMGGAVSFGTLMPMRAIPFRVVCLLGMNDGDYPRRQAPVDFDLMAQPGHARPGDRSRREDDRYLFLEALISARDALYISWVGRNVRDNSVLPPSVLVGQLRDYIDAGWYLGDDEVNETVVSKPLLDAMTTEHPLQPFSRRYFSADANAQVFTYAREWRQAHRIQAAPSLGSALTAWEPDAALGIGHLQGFLSRPVRYFFNHRLKVHFGELDEEAANDEPFGLNALEHHLATATVLHAAIHADDAGDAVETAARHLAEQGALPPGGFGELLQDALTRETRQLATTWLAICAHWPMAADKIELQYSGHGIRIEDWLTDLRIGHDEPLVRLELAAGKLLQKNGDIRYDKLISAWIVHLFAHAQGLRMQSHVIARDAQVTLRALDRDEALLWADELLAAMHEGMRAPLPIARKAAFAWLQNPNDVEKARRQAQTAYEGSDFGYAPGEVQEDACLARAWPSFMRMEAAGFADWLKLYRPLMDVASVEANA
jgi:exodeoxyribonuclease V gamma subunit